MSKIATRSNTRNLKANKLDKTISTAQSTKGLASSANTSYITMKYDYGSDDSKDISKNIIENLRNKLAQQQAINETQTDNDRSQEVNATLRDDIDKMEEKNKQLRQDINRYIKQIEEMNKQQDELKQLARSMFTTTTVANTEEDKYTKEVNMLQTRTSGSCPETINQSAQYLMEDCGEDEILLVRWNDNSVVTLATNNRKIEPLVAAKRYDRKEKKVLVFLSLKYLRNIISIWEELIYMITESQTTGYTLTFCSLANSTLCFYKEERGKQKVINIVREKLYGIVNALVNYLRNKKVIMDNNLEQEFHKIIDGGNSLEENVEEGSQEEYEYQEEAEAMMV
nr:unnamed protein product [Callosobruchus chinensis]